MKVILKYLHATLRRKGAYVISCPLRFVINNVIKQNWKDYKKISNQISGYKALHVLLVCKAVGQMCVASVKLLYLISAKMSPKMCA